MIRDINNRSSNIIILCEAICTVLRLSEMVQTDSNGRMDEIYRRLLDSAGDSIFIHRPGGKFLVVNREACASLGYTSDELLELGPRDITDPSSSSKVRERTDRLLSKGEERFEVTHIRKDGSSFPVDIKLSRFPYIDEPAILAVARDITDYKRIETALRSSEAKYRALFESAGDGIAIHEVNGRFIEVNKTMCERYGMSRDELLHKTPLDMNTPESATGFKDRMAVLLKEGKLIAESVGITPEGRTIYSEINARLIEIDGETRVLTIIRDITDRKMMENELMRANAKLSLLGSITRHDIANRITAVSNYIQLLEGDSGEDSKKNFMKKAQESLSAINVQLRFAADYQKAGTSNPGWTNVFTAIKTATTAFDFTNVIIPHQVRTLELFADPMFEKVIWNLIDNAKRHGGRVTETRFGTEMRGDGLVLIIEDDGQGVPDDEKTKIFEAGHGRNTGMGLFLIREILGITGITISENGKFGVNARFEILVPDGKFRFNEA